MPIYNIFSRQFQRGLELNSTAGIIVDFSVYALIILIGAFQLAHYPHTADFVSDVTYPDLARSLLEQGAYQICFHPQTVLPPGLPFLLVPVGWLFGFTPKALYPVIAVFTGLALVAAYRFLKLVEGRGVAAVACLLLVSSPAMFGFNTAVIFPEMPYFFLSMLALLLAIRIDRTEAGRAPVGWEILLGLVLALAVLVRSVGVALLFGLVTWTAASLLLTPEAGRRRLKRFVIPLVLGLAAQSCWTIWSQHHQVLEWQLPGYPQSYLSQLSVKYGHSPELGLAHVSDLPARLADNTLTRAVGYMEFLSRRYVSPFWSSPAIFGVLVLAAIGLITSLRSGGHLHDWYFIWYECIFLAWPWDFRDRFVIPVVPLACLYLWRGAKELKNYSLRQPKAVGVSLIFLGIALAVISIAFSKSWMAFPLDPQHARGDRLQPIVATLLWILVAAAGSVFVGFHSFGNSLSARSMWSRINKILESGNPRLLRLLVFAGTAVLVVSGTRQVFAVGRNNLTVNIETQYLYPEIESAMWIQKNEPDARVVMAREPEFVCHYAHHPVVWFPPISNPLTLMDGIQRLHVGFIVVAHHSRSYWLPSEDACFQALQQAYPTMFQLIHRGPDNWVYEVASSK